MVANFMLETGLGAFPADRRPPTLDPRLPTLRSQVSSLRSQVSGLQSQVFDPSLDPRLPLANGHALRQLRKFTESKGYEFPHVCTPEEL
jgi:hypothetical protein